MQNHSKCMGCNTTLYRIGFVGFCSYCAADGTMEKCDREELRKPYEDRRYHPIPKEVPRVAHDD